MELTASAFFMCPKLGTADRDAFTAHPLIYASPVNEHRAVLSISCSFCFHPFRLRYIAYLPYFAFPLYIHIYMWNRVTWKSAKVRIRFAFAFILGDRFLRIPCYLLDSPLRYTNLDSLGYMKLPHWKLCSNCSDFDALS